MKILAVIAFECIAIGGGFAILLGIRELYTAYMLPFDPKTHLHNGLAFIVFGLIALFLTTAYLVRMQ